MPAPICCRRAGGAGVHLLPPCRRCRCPSAAADRCSSSFARTEWAKELFVWLAPRCGRYQPHRRRGNRWIPCLRCDGSANKPGVRGCCTGLPAAFGISPSFPCGRQDVCCPPGHLLFAGKKGLPANSRRREGLSRFRRQQRGAGTAGAAAANGSRHCRRGGRWWATPPARQHAVKPLRCG